MKVIIVDRTAKTFKRLGSMEAVRGMTTTSGATIENVGATACKVRRQNGNLHGPYHEIHIDLSVAMEYGWASTDASLKKLLERIAAVPHHNALLTLERKIRRELNSMPSERQAIVRAAYAEKLREVTGTGEYAAGCPKAKNRK